MKVLVATDSFKESMSSLEAGRAIARGVAEVWPEAEIVICPMADGGEGTLDAVVSDGHFAYCECTVEGALGEPRVARFGWDEDSRSALIEIAQAVGLEHVPLGQRDIWQATSYGVGQLISDALRLGPHRIYLTLGGSATNDGGAGMLCALGVEFLDANGNALSPTPSGLSRLTSVDTSRLDARLADVDVVLAVDVDNPLLGVRGASAVFGPQKGAGRDDVPRLDAVLGRLADTVANQTSTDCRGYAGAGAAGGIGWAAMQFLGASAVPGVQMVSQIVGLEQKMAGASLVFTGEGRADVQTLSGKTAFGVAQVASSLGVPVILMAGSLGAGADQLLNHGVNAVVPILRDLGPLQDQLDRGAENLEAASKTTCQLIALGTAF